MEFYVYIMTNISKTLYIGVTNDLLRRISEHKSGLHKGFAKKYKINQLLYYEIYPYVLEAIQRDKSLKHWKREKKVQLIESVNPHWEDLSTIVDC
ncbi:MAG: GIY-YIG nuclease family protein [Proteobacteria bacterium]|nr:GIY-YIG nuclease family protein [Pseudomonadota bacterium]